MLTRVEAQQPVIAPHEAQGLTRAQVEALETLAAVQARESLWAYRQYMNPGMKLGWWQAEVSKQLRQFYRELIAGARPILVLESPPQHGKSFQVIDFTSWLHGRHPDMNTIYTSFSDRLGIRANLRIQRAMDSVKYKRAFPNTRLNTSNIVNVSSQYLRNHSILEFVGHTGSFRNTTVLGSVTGEGLDLGLIDDPLKGREAANNKNQRDKVWDWFTDDFLTRFSEKAGLLMILTRWHVDDPAGRLIAQFGDRVRELRYPAIAEKDEKHRKKGEALFPEHKSLEFINIRRKAMTQSSFESIYQQNPIIIGGGWFPIDKIEVVPATKMPTKKQIKRSVRYWDKAGTTDDGAYTVGVLMHMTVDNQYYIEDVQRAQLGALEREKLIKKTAQIDNSEGRRVDTWVEQEPGSGGKESAENTIRMIGSLGFTCYADKVTGSKDIRCEPYAAQVQGGNVKIKADHRWNGPFLDEHEVCPNGPYRDQCDAAGGAYAKLTGADAGYDTSMSWIDR